MKLIQKYQTSMYSVFLSFVFLSFVPGTPDLITLYRFPFRLRYDGPPFQRKPENLVYVLNHPGPCPAWCPPCWFTRHRVILTKNTEERNKGQFLTHLKNIYSFYLMCRSFLPTCMAVYHACATFTGIRIRK